MGRGAKAEVFLNKGEQNQKWLPHPYLLGQTIPRGPPPIRCVILGGSATPWSLDPRLVRPV